VVDSSGNRFSARGHDLLAPEFSVTKGGRVTSLINHISFDCAPPFEPYELAVFWSQVLGQPVHPDDAPGDDEIGLQAPDGQATLLFLRVPDGICC
jgi:hypothetical protein